MDLQSSSKAIWYGCRIEWRPVERGDVSCSVVRRVCLPDSFFAIDGLLETFITILDQMELYPAMIEQENQRYGPF